MRIFLTGGMGFIGNHVARELRGEGNSLLLLSQPSQNNVASLPIPGIKIIHGDLASVDKWKDEVKSFKPDVAIHIAWESLPDYSARTSIRNLNYGLSLITMLAESGCKSTICTGSCWEYGQQSGKVHEDTPLKPLNAFTAAKNALHWVGREIARENGMHFIWTRLFYVYGPGQRDTSLIPYIISCLRNGKKPEIKMPGARNDFVYVGDVARAIAAIVRKSQRDDVYNIGSGGSTSVQKIIEIIYDKFDLPGKYDRLLNLSKSPVVDFWADISRIKSDIGWEPQSSISEGIAKTINFHTDDCK